MRRGAPHRCASRPHPDFNGRLGAGGLRDPNRAATDGHRRRARSCRVLHGRALTAVPRSRSPRSLTIAILQRGLCDPHGRFSIVTVVGLPASVRCPQLAAGIESRSRNLRDRRIAEWYGASPPRAREFALLGSRMGREASRSWHSCVGTRSASYSTTCGTAASSMARRPRSHGTSRSPRKASSSRESTDRSGPCIAASVGMPSAFGCRVHQCGRGGGLGGVRRAGGRRTVAGVGRRVARCGPRGAARVEFERHRRARAGSRRW